MSNEVNDNTPSPMPGGTNSGRVVDAFIEEEMKTSYLRYSMSVIVSRALPDVRDGLKPVHRRVLYGMDTLSLYNDKPYKKSANIVGEVMGKYHPHGDSSIYDTLVRLAQDFSMRYPLVDGQGNFGSIDGDRAAAMRYTEARMDKITELVLQDLDKDTVDFKPNYDESLKEPTVLPSAFPNLLVNGSTGIAVGMATNMAPHNLREIVNACIAMIHNPEVTAEELLTMVSGPDFPTGGIIQGRSGIRDAYLTGRGRIVVRARCEIETMANGRNRIVVTEIPYQVNKTTLLEKMAALVRDKEVEGISDLRDESDRHGMSIIIELKKDAFAEVVLNTLYKHTQLQDTFGINNLALVEGRPRTLGLRDLVYYFLKHRHEVVERRTRFDLRKAQDRAHILEGLRIALDHIDAIVALIRASADTATARAGLMTQFSLSEKQAEAILEMRLQRLTGLERDKIEHEYQELLKTIADLNDILANRDRRMAIIEQELTEIVAKHGDERRTAIVDSADDIDTLDLIANEPMVITVSHGGYIKRIGTDAYKLQGRGGRGISAAGLKDEDFVEHLFVGWTHGYVLVFTNLGRCHWLRVHLIPEAARTAKGKALINLIQLQPDEKVSAFVPVRGFEDVRSLVFATERGVINKIALEAFSRPRTAGINAVELNEGDRLISVALASPDDHVMIGTKLGQANRFPMAKFRSMGRGTRGVRGINLADDDAVIGMVLVDSNLVSDAPEDADESAEVVDSFVGATSFTVLTVTENGLGKRTNPAAYRVTGRGGKGVRNFRINEKTGAAVCLANVRDDQEILVITRSGIIIRMEAADIRLTGRDTQGVRVIRLDDGDAVTGVTVVEKDDVDPDKLESAEEARALHAAEVAPVVALDAEIDNEAGEDGDESPRGDDETSDEETKS
jgi:DNA gyrase subunit A